ncbi:unnamed protein product [Schistocephalus solidus]|uniref:F-box protein n=1 Tax=Schistocephalus solidus TaxID=70667 RepID=A0A183TN38_SCHSO|nr:unnamed protein product [Schistocephalus solidus]
MGDNLEGKLIKELQKLGVSQYSAPPPEKLTRFADFVHWEASCKDYLQGFDAKVQSGVILVLLGNKVYDLALSKDILVASIPSVVLDGLREILGSSEHPWSCDCTSKAVSNSRKVNLRLPVGPSTPRSEGLPQMDAMALNTLVLK